VRKYSARTEEESTLTFSAQELCYRLYDRPLHPELFQIYQGKQITRDLYSATLWITGCSHVIQFTTGDDTLTEFVGPIPKELRDREHLHGFQFRGEKNIEDIFEDRIVYFMSSQVERMSQAVLIRTHRDLWTHGSSNRLFEAFPPTGEEEFQPFALLDYETLMRELHITAFHCFPAEKIILKTQSIFEVARGR
jgi:hypothetical protein